MFNVPNPSDEEGVSSFEDNLNPNSLTVIKNAVIEKSLANAPVEKTYQFMRNGYFCVDSDTDENSLVFNRTVALRDSFKIK